MSSIASAFETLSPTTIKIVWATAIAVLVSLGITRNVRMGFIGGGMAGLIIHCFVIFQGGIFGFLAYAFWAPVVVVASALGGALSAVVGSSLADKFGRKPKNRL